MRCMENYLKRSSINGCHETKVQMFQAYLRNQGLGVRSCAITIKGPFKHLSSRRYGSVLRATPSRIKRVGGLHRVIAQDLTPTVRFTSKGKRFCGPLYKMS